MELNVLKKERAVLRRCLTKYLNDREGVVRDVLEDKGERLFEIDEKIKSKIVEDETIDEKKLEEEFEKIEEYRTMYKKAMYDLEFGERQNINSDSKSTEHLYRRGIKLPEIKLPIFDGTPQNWIQFWGQFKKIHEDNNLAEEDKYQYLLGSVQGKALQLVSAYPPTAGNYHRVIVCLKNRFAKDAVLIDHYMRNLLQLTLAQAGPQSLTLADLYDGITTNINNLEVLGLTSSKYALMLIPLIELSLPPETLKLWERNKNNSYLLAGKSMSKLALNEDEVPELDEGSDQLSSLMNFLRIEVESEEKVRTNYLEESNNGNMATASALYNSGKLLACLFCSKNNHSSSECIKASNMPVTERRKLIADAKVCFYCWKPSHLARDCKAYVSCFICNGRHHALVCQRYNVTENVYKKNKEISEEDKRRGIQEKDARYFGKEENSTVNCLSQSKGNQICLQTLQVFIVGSNGRRKKVRAVIDSGSQYTYITENCAKELKLKGGKSIDMEHGLFGGQTNKIKHRKYWLDLISLDETNKCSISAFGQERICSPLPKIDTKLVLDALKEKGILLTDTDEDCPSNIEMLIGADNISRILANENKQILPNLTAINTKLGWTLIGQLLPSVHSERCTSLLSLDLGQLWDLESLGIKHENEKDQLEDFKLNVHINEEGRYETELPWLNNIPKLESNFMQAKNRLISTTKKLTKQGMLKEYDTVFQQWQNEDIVEKVDNDKINEGHYLCHHPVIKETSQTTKVRPVFDASCKTSDGVSLNDCLIKGANMVSSIPQLLCGFRLGQIGVIADIKQAFLQISVEQNDRNSLKFLWWNKDGEMATYRHTRIVFGLVSSPYILGATLKTHIENVQGDLQETREVLSSSFYVDNFITSVNNSKALDTLMVQSDEIMKRGKFTLRCWTHTKTSEDHCFDTTKFDCCNNKLYDNKVPVLGLEWNPVEDTMSCILRNIDNISLVTVTKRKILSIVQMLFDPIGIICPVTLIPKWILQKLWILKIDWDSEVPVEISQEFKDWVRHLNYINLCKIQRCLSLGTESKCSIHVFMDGSMKAYASCIFMRSESNNRVNMGLVLAKSRVSPTKPALTIPRLELMAATIAARLYKSIINLKMLKDLPVTFWTDSTVVLSWLNNKEVYKPFITKRIKEILIITRVEDWRHVPGNINPADLLSRGCNAKKLAESKWWEGPVWLMDKAEQWPENVWKINLQEVQSRTDTLLTFEKKYFSEEFKAGKFSSIVRIVGWILRFVNQCRAKQSGLDLNLSGEEVEKAKLVLFTLVQRESFDKENLKQIKNLELFTDKEGTIRVKTRLSMGKFSINYKYPILLPNNHKIVNKLIEETHLQLKHSGVSTLMVALRDDVWISKSRRTIKNIIRLCVQCKRWSAKAADMPLAPLPLERIEASAAFENTGLDLFGPLYTQDHNKVWVLLLTCAVFRAIHLEIVNDLSTESFLFGFRRFIGRRGRFVKHIFCDNGTNFKGAYNALCILDWKQIEREFNIKKITWHFSAPTAAWWGGFWERMVGTVKSLLKRSLGRSRLTHEELYTVLCECEAVINQRPLTYVVEDEDLTPLTPAMFLNNITTANTLDLDRIDCTTIVNRYGLMTRIRECFIDRFKKEYLGLLVGRSPTKLVSNLKLNDIVLVEGEKGRRLFWPLARIRELHKGKDGLIRAVTVQTAKNSYVRPVQRIYPLELQTEVSMSEVEKSNVKPKEELQAEEEVSISESETPTSLQVSRAGRIQKPNSKYLNYN